ncbi:ABC transporter ATP-binding protein/permease [Acinetobacter sp. NIPH 1852]|uniref:ATP-binding cassette domain-containing protein n=1 Tax=Acinetobacter sp. NIPH 1852 TaxID=2923428 RepID=UPI001F4A172E|nr:ABC transporter ATP-binding protein [Acinetobacter sp. NIPH 1852]MCH7308433.1 ABC transporter ATP-binding protein/permease [Acinetobacter sp. NIPH 1852]
MNTVAKLNHEQIFSKLPPAARHKLIAVGMGWVFVAAIEAIAYTVLAFAMVYHWSPIGVVISAIVAILVTVMVTRAGFLTGVRLAGDLFEELGRSLARAKLSWFSNEQRTQVAAMAGQGIPGFMSVPAHQLQTFLHAPFMPLFLLVGIALLAGLRTALVALVLVLLSLLAQFLAQRSLMRTDEKRNRVDLAASQATLELVDHIELLRTAAGPVGAVQRIEHRWQEQEETLFRINRAAAFANFVATFASVLPIAGMAIFLVLTGSHNAALVLALLILIGRASAPLAELAVAGLHINDLISSLRNFNQITHPLELAKPLQAQTPVGFDISIKSISYAPALKHISFDIPFGSRVWVTGPSGSGKSSLLELLMRFDDPQKGKITFGGISLDQMNDEDLVANIAYVTQEPILFTGNLAENIRLGKPDASPEEVETVARRVELGTVIDRSSEGINQSVGQQGAALSGGERQRVAIARALLKDAPILILDEATSALDEKTEQAIVAEICGLSSTVIFVTHRDATIWQPTETLTLTDLT